MVCKYCGFENESYSEFCVNCGASLEAEEIQNEETQAYEENGYYGDNGGYYEESAVQPKKTDGMGIASMVLGIVSLVCCNPGGLFAIVGLILGIISTKKAKASGEKSPFALAGIITCAIAVAFMALSLIGTIIYCVFFGGFTVLMGLLGMTASSAVPYYY